MRSREDKVVRPLPGGAAREVAEEVLAGGYAVEPPVGDPAEFVAAAAGLGAAAAAGCAGGTGGSGRERDRECAQGVAGGGGDDPFGRPTDFKGQDSRESTEVVKRAAHDAGLNAAGREALHDEYEHSPKVTYNEARARAEELYEENSKFRGKTKGGKDPHWTSERERRSSQGC